MTNKYVSELKETAKSLMKNGKGILAMDESNGTCNKRFEKLDIEPTEENRRAYRGLILTAPDLSNYISGAILYDETIRQSTAEGKSFVKVMQDAGIIPGIKVDTGAKDYAGHPGEKVTEGLDGLRDWQSLAEGIALRNIMKWVRVLPNGDR